MSLSNNISALTAFNSLTRVNTAIDKTIHSLSTGLRINSAADDASGLAISENLRAQSAGLDRALRNAQDGISLIQTAEGALGETNSMLQRMRELAVQAANDTLTSQDRSYIQMEIDELKAQIDLIANTTQFNGKNILDGSVCGTFSSTDTNVKGYIRGAIQAEGNYRIEVKANPGEAQVQKSNIMRIKHENVITNSQLNDADGFATLKIDGLPAGDYSISTSMGLGGEEYILHKSTLEGEATEANTNKIGETMTLTFNTEDNIPAKFEGIVIPPECSQEEIAQIVIKTINERGSINIGGEEITLKASQNGDTGYTIEATGRKHVTSMTSSFSLNNIANATYGHHASRVEWDFIDDIRSGGNDGGGSFVVTVGDTSVNVPSSGSFARGTSASVIAEEIKKAVNTATGTTNAFVSGSGSSYRVWVAPHSDGLSYNVRPGATYTGGWQLPSTVNKHGNTYNINETVNIPEADSVGASTVTITLGNKQIAQIDIDDGATQDQIFAKIKNTLGNSINFTPNSSSRELTLDVSYDDTNHSFTVKSNDSSKDVWINEQQLVYSFKSKATEKGKANATEDVDAYDPKRMTTAEAISTLTGSYGLNADDAFSVNLAGKNGKAQNNASVLFTVTGATYNETSKMGTVTLSAVSNVLGVDGTSKTLTEQKIVLSTNHKSADLGSLLGEDDDHFTLSLKDSFDISSFKMGDKFVYNICGVGDVASISADTSIVLQGKQDSSWPYSWDDDNGGYVTRNNSKIQYNINADAVSGKELHFRNFYLNSESGKVYDADITIGLTPDFNEAAKNFTGDPTTAAAFTANYVGKIAEGDTKLRDLEQFWNSSGVFMLEQPQVITISQNDGKEASITLNASDTLNDVRQKLNDAISDGLGQGLYVHGGNADKIVTFVENPDDGGGLESVKGTFLIRSLIPGNAGKLTFSSDNGKLVDALGLNTVIDAQESGYTVSVYNAHDNSIVARNVKTAGNMLRGVIDKNVDIEFSPMPGVNAVWSEAAKNFVITPDNDAYTATVHIVKNNITFQTGANEGQEITLDIGNMSASSLGISGVNVMTHTRAASAITTIDAALRQVSSQRSKLGTYQNGLEHTLENLVTANEGMTAAESRIRDADMSKSMMDLVKFRIINQSSTAMLAQANQLSRSVMNLVQQ